MSERPDIVLLVLDSVRYDALDPDEGFADTPFIDKLSSESVFFQRAYSPAPWTVPSHASMFTGTYPTEHETSHGGSKHLNPEYPTLAEQLSAAGYHTEIYTNNIHLVPEFGFTRGFDDINRGPLVANEDDLIDWNSFIENREHDSGVKKYIEICKHILGNRDKQIVESLRSGYRMKSNYHRGDSGGQAAVDHFSQRREPDRPTFTFVNLMEAHNPFRPPEAFRDYDPIEISGWEYELGEQSLTEEEMSALRSLYRGEVEYLDGIVRQLYEILTDENTVFVVTSDHGVSIGEHQKLYHGSCLYEGTIHVPLLIDGVGSSRRVESTTGIIGLFRTLLELANTDVPPHACGTNVLNSTADYALAEMHGSDDWLERYAEEQHGKEAAQMISSTRRALVKSDRKLIRNEDTGEKELYDLRSDPDERCPINDASEARELNQQLNSIIDGFEVRTNHSDQEELSEEMEQTLKDLGYMK